MFQGYTVQIHELFPRAILLEDLGLERAISMAKNGAKVLHLEALLWCQKSGITLIANATANPVGQGTRLESRPSDPKELPIVAFDKELIALFNPSEEMLVRVDGAIRYQTIMNGVDTVIVDTRNLHCEWDTWIFQKVATVTVFGWYYTKITTRVDDFTDSVVLVERCR